MENDIFTPSSEHKHVSLSETLSNLVKANEESSNNALDSLEETPAELSEVDLGNKDQTDFDELISFNHSYLNYRICRCPATREEFDSCIFGLLTQNEFLSANYPISIDSLSKMSNTELIQTVKRSKKDFHSSEPHKKLSYLENIPYYVKEIGIANMVDFILPILLTIEKEKDNCVQKFLSVFNKTVDLLSSHGEEGYTILRDHFIGILINIFDTKKDETTIKMAGDALVYLTRYIKDDDKGEKILTLVIKMAHDDINENNRILSIKLFNELAIIIGQELCEIYVVPQIDSFSDDQSYKVRKAILINFENICKAVSKNIFTHRLLPVYKRLSKDSIWLVRKQAAETLPKLTVLCDKDTINTVLLEIYNNFAMDSKNFVRNSAVGILGEFLSLLNKDNSKEYEQLLDFYVKTVNDFYNEKSKDNETIIIEKCAFNFPSILYFFGKDSWGKLKSCYQRMSEDKSDEVKKSLASSLGEISKILGPELTESDLVGYVEKFFKMSKELQLKIFGILPDIIRNINSPKKNSYLEYLLLMIRNRDGNEKWRRKLQYAKIVGKFDNTYSDEMIYKRVFPIAMNFCFEDANSVRFKSAKSNSRLILQLLSSETEYKDKTLKIVVSFARCINYNYRQEFILMCKDLFENKNLFENIIGDLLLDLAYDKVFNVRYTLSKFINKVFTKNKYDWVKDDVHIRKIVTILKKDKSTDIQKMVQNVNVEPIEVEFNVKVNEKFNDNMKFLSDEFGITKNVPLKYVSKYKTQNVQNSTENSTSGETKK